MLSAGARARRNARPTALPAPMSALERLLLIADLPLATLRELPALRARLAPGGRTQAPPADRLQAVERWSGFRTDRPPAGVLRMAGETSWASATTPSASPSPPPAARSGSVPSLRPSAANSFCPETLRPAADAAWVCCADPVWLVAELDHLRLGAWPLPGLGEDDAAALAAALGETLAERGLRLEVAAPGRWYLVAARPLEVEAPAPAALGGENLARHLPRGADARMLAAVLNEIQMILHEHPVNEARAARGLPPANGVWAWGGGIRRTGEPEPALPALAARDPELRGRWLLAGHAAEPAPRALASLLERCDRPAAVVQPPGDELERDWLTPLVDALDRGRLRDAAILPSESRPSELAGALPAAASTETHAATSATVPGAIPGTTPGDTTGATTGTMTAAGPIAIRRRRWWWRLRLRRR